MLLLLLGAVVVAVVVVVLLLLLGAVVVAVVVVVVVAVVVVVLLLLLGAVLGDEASVVDLRDGAPVDHGDGDLLSLFAVGGNGAHKVRRRIEADRLREPGREYSVGALVTVPNHDRVGFVATVELLLGDQPHIVIAAPLEGDVLVAGDGHALLGRRHARAPTDHDGLRRRGEGEDSGEETGHGFGDAPRDGGLAPHKLVSVSSCYA